MRTICLRKEEKGSREQKSFSSVHGILRIAQNDGVLLRADPISLTTGVPGGVRAGHGPVRQRLPCKGYCHASRD